MALNWSLFLWEPHRGRFFFFFFFPVYSSVHQASQKSLVSETALSFLSDISLNVVQKSELEVQLVSRYTAGAKRPCLSFYWK